MERLNIKFLSLILLLSGCQMIEINNDESIEFIPDLSVSIDDEIIESNQTLLEDNIESSSPKIINIWDVLKNETVIKEYEIDDLTLYYMNQHLRNVDLFENYLYNSYYFSFLCY